MVVFACHLPPELPPNRNETRGNPMIKLDDNQIQASTSIREEAEMEKQTK
jgi:hypothetical protein